MNHYAVLHIVQKLCVLAKLLQSFPILCNSMDCSPPGSSVHGILQARILEWVAMPSSRGSSPTQGLNLSLLCFLHWQLGSLPLVSSGRPTKTILQYKNKHKNKAPDRPNRVLTRVKRSQVRKKTQEQKRRQWTNERGEFSVLSREKRLRGFKMFEKNSSQSKHHRTCIDKTNVVSSTSLFPSLFPSPPPPCHLVFMGCALPSAAFLNLCSALSSCSYKGRELEQT